MAAALAARLAASEPALHWRTEELSAVPLACCSDSSSSEDEDDEEGSDFKEDDEANRNADEDGASYDKANCNEDAESCGGSDHEDAEASCNEGGEQGGGSTDGVAAGAQSTASSSSGSPASRQAAIWRRLKRKHPGSQWAPATQRAS